MLTDSFENDAKVWVTILKNTLHSGNHIGCSRLYALQMMIDKRLGWQANGLFESERKYAPTMETCSRLCEFAKQPEVSANEKNIFMHIMIDLLTIELNNLPKEAPRRLQSHFDHLDEMYPDDVPDLDLDQPLDLGWDIPL